MPLRFSQLNTVLDPECGKERKNARIRIQNDDFFTSEASLSFLSIDYFDS